MTTKQDITRLIDRSVDSDGAFEAITPRLHRATGRGRRRGALVAAMAVLTLGVGVLVLISGDASEAPPASDSVAPTTTTGRFVPPPDPIATVIADHPFADGWATVLTERQDGSLVALVGRRTDGSVEAWGSPNGSDWNLLGTITDGSSQALLEVEGRLIALVETFGGTLLCESTDGVSWSSTALPSGEWASSLVATPRGWAIGGHTPNGPAVWLDSGSGLELVQLPGSNTVRNPVFGNDQGNDTVRDLTVGDDQLVAVGMPLEGARSWVVDLDTSEVSSSDVLTQRAIVNWVTFDGATYLAYGTDNDIPAIWRSDDGLSWQSVATSGLPPQTTGTGLSFPASTQFGLLGSGIAPDPDNYSQALWHSPDGADWEVLFEPSDPLDPPAFDPPAFLSIGTPWPGGVLVAGTSIVLVTADAP